MVGDFMFAHAADFIASTGSVRLVQLFARTIMRIATGELEQDFGAFDASKGIRDYFGRIAGKTASLFGTACEGGAIAAPDERDQPLIRVRADEPASSRRCVEHLGSTCG